MSKLNIRVWRLAALLLALLIGQQVGRAAQDQVGPLRVGVAPLPPLAIPHEEGWDGIAVSLWQDVAGDMDLRYEWVEVSADAGLAPLLEGEVDVLITASATAEAEAVADLSHSYLTTSIAYARGAERGIREIAGAFLTPRFWRTAGTLSVLLLVVGALIWAVERRADNEMFPEGAGSGLWSGFWYAAVTFTTVGYGDKTPKTTGGRVLALLWMLVGIGVLATLTATLASLLTVGAQAEVNFPGDLREAAVGAEDEGAAPTYLEEQGIAFERFETAEAGLRAVAGDELDFFVGSGVILRHLNETVMEGELAVADAHLRRQRFAFALPPGDLRMESLNRALLARINGRGWRDLLARYGVE